MKRTEKLYAVTALFDTPDEIIAAAEKTAAKGYKKWDVNTPYPVHGMDAAMDIGSSKLGYITLAFGLFGAAFALAFMAWVMTEAYPMIIGGKPFFALPAFIPVTFEVTVLLATLSTIIGMLTFFYNFPNNKHPLHDTPYMKAVSVDRFGVVIEADNEHFNIEEAKSFLSSIGGKDIAEVNEVNEVKEEHFTSLQPRFIFLLAVVAIVTSFGTYIALNKLMFLPPFDWMSFQPRQNVQTGNAFFADGFGMRQPVEGSVARGFIPYVMRDADNTKEPEYAPSNPLFATVDVLKRGEEQYDIYCSPCHGYHAEGDSRLRGQFPAPPSLHSTKVREWDDGQLYHVISIGQNTMPAYDAQLSREDRWAVVHYVRALQRAMNASAEDVKFVRKEMAEDE